MADAIHLKEVGGSHYQRESSYIWHNRIVEYMCAGGTHLTPTPLWCNSQYTAFLTSSYPSPLQVAALASDPLQEPVPGDDAEAAMWLDVAQVSALEGGEGFLKDNVDGNGYVRWQPPPLGPSDSPRPRLPCRPELWLRPVDA